MVIGLPCCCSDVVYSRKTAMLTVPYPGQGEFEMDENGIIQNKTGWLTRRYCTYRIFIDRGGGDTTEYLGRYNRYTGAYLMTQTGPGSVVPPQIPLAANFGKTVCTYTDTGLGISYSWALSDPYDIDEVFSFWQPHFETFFPSGSMPNDTTITARAGTLNAGNPGTNTDRPFDFTENFNRVVQIRPYRATPTAYKGGVWDNTFEYVLYNLTRVDVWPLGGNPISSRPQSEIGFVYFSNGGYYGVTSTPFESCFTFIKSCLRLPDGMNCDVDYDGSGSYELKDVVQGILNTDNGAIERHVLNLRLAPGVYVFTENISTVSGRIIDGDPQPVAETELGFFMFREALSGIPEFDEQIFNRIPDYCPP